MKKYILCIFIFIQVNVLLAQVSIGAFGGLNNATGTVDTRNIKFTTTEPLYGAVVGVTAQYAYLDWLITSVDLHYITKGYQVRKYVSQLAFENKNTFNSDFWNLQMHFIELPIQQKMYVEGRTLGAFIGAGFSFGYWIAGTKHGTFVTNSLGSREVKTFSVSEPYQFDNSYQFDNKKDNRFSISIVASAGLTYKIKSSKLVFEARYLYGLNDTYSYNIDRPKSISPLYLNNLSFNIGYLYTFPSTLKYSIEEDDDED
jgi:hypothetical protein